MFPACVCACVCALLAVSSAQLSEDDHLVIVDQHNLYRAQVSPSAVYMRTMSWDENLKIVAEAYAAKCIWDHNPDMENFGENLYVTTGPLDPAEAIGKWFKEYEYYNYTSNECQEGKMCGHYTQVVWAESHKVGCAAHLCEELEGLEEFGKTTILVCNYFPAGNYEGQKPYAEGHFCSRCPEDMPRCQDFLCAPEEQPSEAPDLTESWATEAPPSSEFPGTATPLPPHSTLPEGDFGLEEVTVEGDTGLEEVTVEGDSGLEEVTVEGDSGLEEVTVEGDSGLEEVKVEGDSGLEEVTVEGDSGLDVLVTVDVQEETGTPSNTLHTERKGRIIVIASGQERNQWPGMLLLLIGSVTCLLA